MFGSLNNHHNDKNNHNKILDQRNYSAEWDFSVEHFVKVCKL